MNEPKTLAMYSADMLAGLDNLTVILQGQGRTELAIWVKEVATQFDEKFTNETKTDLMMQRHIFKVAMWEKVGARFGLSLGFMHKVYGGFLSLLGQDSNRSTMERAQRMAVNAIGAGLEGIEEAEGAKKESSENEGAEQKDNKQLGIEQKGITVKGEDVDQEEKKDVKIYDGKVETGKEDTEKEHNGKEKDWKKEAEALLAEDEAGKEEPWM